MPPDTQVSDLAPLTGLSALQTLDVWTTKVTDLAPLAGLSALQTLDVSCTRVTDLAPLAGLSALQVLDVSCTKVTDLVPLAGLLPSRRLASRLRRSPTLRHSLTCCPADAFAPKTKSLT